MEIKPEVLERLRIEMQLSVERDRQRRERVAAIADPAPLPGDLYTLPTDAESDTDTVWLVLRVENDLALVVPADSFFLLGICDVQGPTIWKCRCGFTTWVGVSRMDPLLRMDRSPEWERTAAECRSAVAGLARGTFPAGSDDQEDAEGDPEYEWYMNETAAVVAAVRSRYA